MIRNKKSQFALEFVVIIAFMLLIFVGFFAVVSTRILDAKEEENKQIAEELANLVFEEIKLANSAVDGYKRLFTIPKKIDGIPYDISIVDNRELVVNYSGTEHVVFLPGNLIGDVEVGTNEISKVDGIVILTNIAECNDNIDNDGDGNIDLADVGCDNDPTNNDETNCGDNVCEGFESCTVCSPDCGVCPSPNILIMRDALSNSLSFTQGGNVILKGILQENSNPTPSSSDEFIFKNSAGSNVAIVNLVTGNMFIKASLFENQPSLTPSDSSDDFILKNFNGDVVGYIDDSGNFYLRGTLTQNVGGPPPQGGEKIFILQDSNSVNVAIIDTNGNLILKGTLEQSSTYISTGNNEFRLIDNSANDIVIVDLTNGNMSGC